MEKLLDWIRPNLVDLANQCALAWHDVHAIDQVLLTHQPLLPACDLSYVVDQAGVQVSANILYGKLDSSCRGQDLSRRPFLTKNTGNLPLFISATYISKVTHEPCLTMTHEIVGYEGARLGCVAIDLPLSKLPLEPGQPIEKQSWRQIKGDPSIRSTVFMQERSESLMDQHLDDVIDIVTNLIVRQGVFHAKLHFSSSRASLWNMDDPFDYQIHVLEQITDPSLCLIYPNRAYPQNARTKEDVVPRVIQQFKGLRQLDETIYLRSASLNIMNDMVSLTFSCDGTHYMTSSEFLTRGTTLF